MTKKQIPSIKLTPSKQQRDAITKEDTKPVQTFEEGINRIMKKFRFPAETRRKIFSEIQKIKDEQQPKKGSQNDHNQQ